MSTPMPNLTQAPMEPNLQTQQLLSQLHDIVIPEAVGWWPISQTLIALLVGLGGITIGLIWYFWTQRKINQYRRQAKTLFDEAMSHAKTPQQKLQRANQLLKQVAITTYGRKAAAPLTGKAWVEFLKTNALYIDQPEPLQSCLDSIYHPSQEINPIDLEATLTYVQNWIKGHHR